MELSNLYIGAKFDTLNQQEIKEIATWCNEQTNPKCYLYKYPNGGYEIMTDTFTPSERDLVEQQLYELKEELHRWKEDVEQVELFGMERSDYETKKKRCAEIIIELRELENKLIVLNQ